MINPIVFVCVMESIRFAISLAGSQRIFEYRTER